MPDLHPEVLKMIKAGPRKRMSPHTGIVITEHPQEFARRIALRAVELEREGWVKECAAMVANQCLVPDGILAGEGGHFYCSVQEDHQDECLSHLATLTRLQAVDGALEKASEIGFGTAVEYFKAILDGRHCACEYCGALVADLAKHDCGQT